MSEKKKSLEELRDLRKRGVRVFIDGVEEPESRWKKLFKKRRDGAFYMGDYITGREERGEREILKEIRFERVVLKTQGL